MDTARSACLVTLLAAAVLPHPVLASDRDAAGNRMVTFAATTPPPRRAYGTPDPFALHCTADRRWCARLRRAASGSGWTLELTRGTGRPRSFTVPAPEDDATRLEIWPHLVVERGG